MKQELQKYIKNGQLKLKEKLVKKRMRKLKISATNEFTTDAHSLLPEMQRPNPELALQQLLKLLKSLPQLTLILPIYSVEDEFIKTCTSEFTGSGRLKY